MFPNSTVWEQAGNDKWSLSGKSVPKWPRLEAREKIVMRLKIKDFHVIKSADIQVDGLTVIAGENDTGKSTVGKILFSEIRNSILKNNHKKNDNIEFSIEKETTHFPVFIDTPDFLSKFNYLKNSMVLLQQHRLNFALPNEVGDLILRISQPLKLTRHNKKFQVIKKLIQGEIYYDASEDNIFYRKNGLENKLDMHQTSNGVKMFGFLQMLILNGTIKKGNTLIFDEPEIHLHPKWQVEYSKMIVSLVAEGTKVLVTSHSPYMIEALELYSKKENITACFYLANKIDESSAIENVSNNLELIYKKLAEPISMLEELDDAE
ncbi:MAG: ATP-binding protein [Gammaproteobacteria bacterium]|nr:ATP-binding protein [Gammaproteobacteria bacterium]